MTSSLSIGLGPLGSRTRVSLGRGVYLNGAGLDEEGRFATRLKAFLTYFPLGGLSLKIETESDFPVAAGLASSASGFAALVLAMDHFFGWGLSRVSLSLLARLGSGSACRSLWPGFVRWERGEDPDGWDSHGVPLSFSLPGLRVGILTFSCDEKPVSSREAMVRTVATSDLYAGWSAQVAADLGKMEGALAGGSFEGMGVIAEHNALSMHGMLWGAWPPVIYSLPETVAAYHRVWALREEGVKVYLTQDAGPNVKLLFLEGQTDAVTKVFPDIKVMSPFEECERV